MSNITNYLSAIEEAKQIKKEWKNRLDTLTPRNFHDAYVNTSIHLNYNKDDQSFTIQYNPNEGFGRYAVQQLKDMGFVNVVFITGGIIYFKVPQSNTNDYIKSIHDATIYVHREANDILADITPAFIKELELGLINFKNYHKEKFGYSIDLIDKFDYNHHEDKKEYGYIMNELEKMGFSNVQWSGSSIYFEIK